MINTQKRSCSDMYMCAFTPYCPLQELLGFRDLRLQFLKLSIQGFGCFLDEFSHGSGCILLDIVLQMAFCGTLTKQLGEIESTSRRVQLVREVILSIDSSSGQEGLLCTTHRNQLVRCR